MLQRFERVALRRGVVVDDPVERDVMPGSRRLLPELPGRRAHLVGPVGGIDQAFAGPEDFADMRAGEAGELRVGNCSDDPVAGLAPGERGRGKDESRHEGGGKQAGLHTGGYPKIRLTSACPLPPTRHKSMTEDELVARARAAAAKAYAPYSNFQVGCAVESIDGEIVTGANMEN